MLKKVSYLFLFFSFFFLLDQNFAIAHKVMIFAYLEGDTVYTESKFSGGKKVTGGKIIVRDLKGNQLLEGKTDNNGEFFFKIPEKTALKIVLNAGMGHTAFWIIPLNEIEELVTTDIEEKTSSNETKVLKQKTDITEFNIPVPELTEKKIKILIEKALDKKLKPLMKILINIQEKKPDIHDIFSGIGYIFGLFGVAVYILSRKKNNSNKS